MAINYTGLAAIAERLIRESGREVSIVKRSAAAPSGEPWEDDGTSEAETTLTVDAVFLDDLVQAIPGEPESDRTWIGTILIAAQDAGAEDLTTFDLIRDDGRHIELASVRPLKPGSVSLLYIASKAGG